MDPSEANLAFNHFLSLSKSLSEQDARFGRRLSDLGLDDLYLYKQCRVDANMARGLITRSAVVKEGLESQFKTYKDGFSHIFNEITKEVKKHSFPLDNTYAVNDWLEEARNFMKEDHLWGQDFDEALVRFIRAYGDKAKKLPDGVDLLSIADICMHSCPILERQRVDFAKIIYKYILEKDLDGANAGQAACALACIYEKEDPELAIKYAFLAVARYDHESASRFLAVLIKNAKASKGLESWGSPAGAVIRKLNILKQREAQAAAWVESMSTLGGPKNALMPEIVSWANNRFFGGDQVLQIQFNKGIKSLDITKSLALLKRKVTDGSKIASYLLGVLYEKGIASILAPDSARAMHYMNRAAKEGSKEALAWVQSKTQPGASVTDNIYEELKSLGVLEKDQLPRPQRAAILQRMAFINRFILAGKEYQQKSISCYQSMISMLLDNKESIDTASYAYRQLGALNSLGEADTLSYAFGLHNTGHLGKDLAALFLDINSRILGQDCLVFNASTGKLNVNSTIDNLKAIKGSNAKAFAYFIIGILYSSSDLKDNARAVHYLSLSEQKGFSTARHRLLSLTGAGQNYLTYKDEVKALSKAPKSDLLKHTRLAFLYLRVVGEPKRAKKIFEWVRISKDNSFSSYAKRQISSIDGYVQKRREYHFRQNGEILKRIGQRFSIKDLRTVSQANFDGSFSSDLFWIDSLRENLRSFLGGTNSFTVEQKDLINNVYDRTRNALLQGPGRFYTPALHASISDPDSFSILPISLTLRPKEGHFVMFGIGKGCIIKINTGWDSKQVSGFSRKVYGLEIFEANASKFTAKDLENLMKGDLAVWRSINSKNLKQIYAHPMSAQSKIGNCGFASLKKSMAAAFGLVKYRGVLQAKDASKIAQTFKSIDADYKRAAFNDRLEEFNKYAKVPYANKEILVIAALKLYKYVKKIMSTAEIKRMIGSEVLPSATWIDEEIQMNTGDFTISESLIRQKSL